MRPLLESAGFEVDVSTLEAGDYFFPEIKMIWSWKSYKDFLTSVHTDHLRDEIAKMILAGNDHWQGLIVWKFGSKDQKYDPFITRNRILELKNLVEHYNAMYIPVWDVGTRETGIEVMRRWYLKSLDREFPMQLWRNVVAADKKLPTMVRMLMGIKGVGEDISLKIHQKYRTIDRLLVSVKDSHIYDQNRWKTKKQWNLEHWYHDIDLLGPTKAQQIYEALMGEDE
jgi:hypothetical protein